MSHTHWTVIAAGIKKMKTNRVISLVGAIAFATFGLMTGTANAAVILNSGNADCSGPLDTPSEPNVQAAFFSACATGEVDELYKSDFEDQATGTDSGPFAASYTTTFGGFGEDMEDPTTSLIEHVLGEMAIAGYDRIFVLAKGGSGQTNGRNGTPRASYYGWNISDWDGTESLDITAWDNVSGSISHVSIWGEGGVNVPEPGPVGLLGAGLIALYWARRRIRTA